MKKIFVLLTALTTLFACTPAFAALKGTPYQPEVDSRFSTAEDAIDAVEADVVALEALPANVAYTSTGIQNPRIARVTYNVDVHGTAVGAHGLGVSLPAKAIITESWFYTDTQFADSGSGTVALSCEDANNIFTATDITGNAAGTIVDGATPPGETSGFYVKNIAAACEITATVASAAQTSGKLTAFIKYVVHD